MEIIEVEQKVSDSLDARTAEAMAKWRLCYVTLTDEEVDLVNAELEIIVVL